MTRQQYAALLLEKCYNFRASQNERKPCRADRFRSNYLSSRRSQPNIFANRRQRRTLRRIAGTGIAIATKVVEIVGGSNEGVGTTLLSIGRAIAGLVLVGMIGVIVSVPSAFVYNSVFNRPVSLIDLDYIDGGPLLFAAVGGIAGIPWSLKWDQMIGLLGW